MADFIAQVTFSAEKKTPVGNEYHPVIKFENSDDYIPVEMELLGKEMVFAGDTCEAGMTILYPKDFTGTIYEGQNFEFTEKQEPVGSAVIIKIINLKLKG